ncbi:MAG: HAD-IIIC family phosphatase [Elusimicrobiota bacterium]|jgi:FkbH-like protein
MRLTLVSDFNIELLGRYLANAPSPVKFSVSVTAFNQVPQALAAPLDSGTEEQASFVWTRAESVIPSFAEALAFKPADAAACLAETDAFAEALLGFAKAQRCCLVASWVLPPGERGYGPLDWRLGLGLAGLVAQMNLRLAERLARAGNILILDASRWMAAGARADAPKMWFTTKVPYSHAVLQGAASDVTAALAADAGLSRRIIILDLDNTLWGGVVGETGWEGLRLGGHDHIGEAHEAFQLALKALSRRGVQLALASKNEESTALEALDRHPAMALRRGDFAGWRINWGDKAANIAALLDDLRLGQDAAVFIDDEPAERDRVRTALPGILVPEWPSDPAEFIPALRALRCFDAASLSPEDRERTGFYAAERSRRESQTSAVSSEDWLLRLGSQVRVEPVAGANIKRVAQLFNKTNQLNLSTRRLSESQILDWASSPERTLLALSVSDRFGDMGLTGVIGLERSGKDMLVTDFILSCRIMGRRVEQAMLHLAVEHCQRRGAERLLARYLPTPRNAPTLRVLRESGLSESAGGIFSWDCGRPFPKPEGLTLSLAQGVDGAPA